MNVVIQGRQHRFIGGSLGDKPITEIWLGDKQIWPNTEGLARRIVVELPQKGTRDWQYWVHAVDSIQKEVSASNYMRFNHDGLNFYIQHSFDGSEAYKLDGNVLTVELDGILIDQLGEYLEVDAVIPERAIKITGSLSEGDRSVSSSFPMLPGSKTQWRHWGWKRGKSSWWHQTLTSEPSQIILVDSGYRKSGRTPVTNSSIINTVPESDIEWHAVISMTGKGTMDWYQAVYPSFKRKFKLKILSVS